MRILMVLAGLAGHHKKTWCFPNQLTIIKLMQQHYRRVMSRRQLNRHLLTLETRGYIERVRRHKKSANGALELHSTLYKLKSYAVQTLGKMQAFIGIVRAHPWARLWISAVSDPTQCIDQQINIIPEPPKKRADSS